MCLRAWGSQQKSAKCVQETLGNTYRENSVLLLLSCDLCLWECGLCSGETWVGSDAASSTPILLTLTSFPEECFPSLATDAQDEATEHDGRGKLHPKTESQANTTKHEALLLLFLDMVTYPSLPKLNSTQSYTFISISICTYR